MSTITININKGDLLSVTRGIIVHGCNCQGVMGSGVALAIRNKYPTVYKAYNHKHKDEGYLRLGTIMSFTSQGKEDIPTGNVDYWIDNEEIPSGLIIVNAMTQFDMVKSSDPDEVVVDYDAITSCFAQIKILAKTTGLPVHFPLIGCGLANGKWEEVKPRIEAALGPDIEKHLWLL